MTTCEIGGYDDLTLRVCCSTHDKLLCAHHYARTHFVETDPAWPKEFSCVPQAVRDAGRAYVRLTRYIEKDEFLTLPVANSVAKRHGYEGLEDMKLRAPQEFLDLVEALCVEMEEDPPYSGNPETGKEWE
jgi:hypothetical protein